jgi:hypothetical protein
MNESIKHEFEMTRWTILLLTLLFFQTMGAQSTSPTVVNSAGGVIQNNSHSLEWSLGELAVSTLTSPNNLLTQGFLQPNVIIVGTEDLFDESRLMVFPNPVSDWLNLQTDIPDIKTIQVHDVLGRLVLQREFQPLLDVQRLESGTFIISLFNKQNQFLHALKINKI